MSNLLYAVSIMYKTQLPFILVFNKTDVEPMDKCEQWINDYTLFPQDLDEDEGYMNGLVGSMSLLLEEFYKCLRIVGVSAVTGEGLDDLFEEIQKARLEYFEVTVPMLEKQKVDIKTKENEKKRMELDRLMNDINITGREERVEEDVLDEYEI
jgi:translation initiation factor IF-2